MKLAVFSTRPYDRAHLAAANSASGSPHVISWIDAALSLETASFAAGFEGVCAFVNDRLDAPVLSTLAAGGTRLIALRCAGYNHVDLPAAVSLGLTVSHVPAYSPHAVAEHAVALLLTLNRRTHLAHARVQRRNFTLDGLEGVDLHGKTIGLIGTGRIGVITGRILQGFGCRVLAHDPAPPADARAAGFEFVALDDLLAQADVVSLHCPELPSTRHIINAATLARMKPSAFLINTSRGGVIDTAAAIDALENNRLGGLGLDVYEHEAALFFGDHSGDAVADPLFARLMAAPNALVTGHQGFLTREALDNIAGSVLAALDAFAAGQSVPNALQP